MVDDTAGDADTRDPDAADADTYESGTADAYTHDPDGADEPRGPADAAGRDDSSRDRPGRPAGDGLSTRDGWLIAAALAALLVGSPVAVYAWPPGFLGFRDAYLAVAMVPGLLLGVLGLWAATRAS